MKSTITFTAIIGFLAVLGAGSPPARAQAVGPDDFRISFVGGSGDPDTYGEDPSVACRSTGTECLVVFEENLVPGASPAPQISGQRIDASTGAHIGSPISISSMSNWAQRPDVAYDPDADRYVVVWFGFHDVGGGQIEAEIFGQLIDAATGAEVGVDDFRISHFGPAGDTSYQADHPSVADNSIQSEFLVVFVAEGGGVPRDVMYQRLDASTGTEIGADVDISSFSGIFGAESPAVAHDSLHDEYLVVWRAWIDAQGTGLEVFGQRLDGATGTEIGTDDFRISITGVDNVAVNDHQSHDPEVAYSSEADRFIVVWMANDDPEPQMAVLESELYMQAIAGGSGALVDDRARLSDMGGLGATAYRVYSPSVACGEGRDCLVVWYGDDTGYSGLVDGEYEVFSQVVDAITLSEIGANDARLSTMGPDGDPDYDAVFPVVASSPGLSRYLTVWAGDNLIPFVLDEGEYEIWGQLVAGGLIFGGDFESGDLAGWSTSAP